jgi:hypothetical protein
MQKKYSKHFVPVNKRFTRCRFGHIAASVENTEAHGLTLNSGWVTGTEQMIYHSFHLTEGLILTFLNLAGVPPSKVTRFKAPDDPSHVVFVIDTRGLEEARRVRCYPDYLRPTLELGFTR